MATKRTAKGAAREERTPKTVEILEPSTRTLTQWTPTLIESAELLANAGTLRLAADLCEQILGDDRASGVLSARVDGLLGLPLKFEAGIGRRKHKALRALEAEEDWWAIFPEDQLRQLAMWGILLGVGVGQIPWQVRDNGRTIPTLRHYRERWLRFDWSTRKWMLWVDQPTGPGVGVMRGGLVTSEVEILPGDGRWIMYAPGGLHLAWLHGAWRGLSRWWLMKQYARADFARHSEVHGAPWRVAVNPSGDSKTDRKKIASDLAQMARDGSISLPAGWDVKLIEATARTWEMFVAQVKMANDGMTIAINGQNLTTEVTGGSLAAAQVHAEGRNDKMRLDDQTLATTLHDQALEPWAEVNFGDRGAAPWPLHETEPPEDTKTVAATWVDVAGAVKVLGEVARSSGSKKRVDFDAVAEKFGIPLRDATPEETEPKTPEGTTETEPDVGDPNEADEPTETEETTP